MTAFSSFTAFIHMGGHGAFVWSAYGIALTVMIWLVAGPWWRHRQLLRELGGLRQQGTEQ